MLLLDLPGDGVDERGRERLAVESVRSPVARLMGVTPGALAPGVAVMDDAILEVPAQIESGHGVSQIARLAGRDTRQGLAPVRDQLGEHGVVPRIPEDGAAINVAIGIAVLAGIAGGRHLHHVRR